MTQPNNLYIVGSGIKFMSHLTMESKACIEKAEKVLHLANEPAIEVWINHINPNSESLDFLYDRKKNRKECFIEIAGYILECLSRYKSVCVVMYGHPCVLVSPTMLAAKMAKEKDHSVFILPGISADACLFADLQIDPSSSGCLSYEATDFLLYKRPIVPNSHLILWQISMIGINTQPLKIDSTGGLLILVEYLAKQYPLEHNVIVYEAALYPGFKPVINSLCLNDLKNFKPARYATLYIPPLINSLPDSEMLEKLKNIQN